MSPSALPTVLVVDDELRSAQSIARTLEDDFNVLTAPGAREALDILENEWVQLVFCDQRMPEISGVELLTQMRERWPEIIRVIITGYTDASDIIRAVNDAGIYQYVGKPWQPEDLLMIARNGVELYQLQREHDRLSLEMKLLAPSMQSRLENQRSKLRRNFSFENIVRAPDSPMNAVCAQAAQVASFDVPALILGETGTGKELLARAMHYASLRADKPFFAVNCGAIPDELLESELFGHRKGAFTGAHANRIGLFEQADGGTVFLDEIGEVSPSFQVKLLRFLQEGELRPVGANETREVDVRVIAATNRDLEEAARSGAFRLDLFYRLAVFPISPPPLRDRRMDVARLADALLERACARHGKRVRGFSGEALDRLSDYHWPGNIRELENQVTRMLILGQQDLLGAELIAPEILRAAPEAALEDPAADVALAGAGTLKERVERMEARLLRETLTRHGWNKSRAAEELGLSRVGLRAKLDRYGLSNGEGGAEPSEEFSEELSEELRDIDQDDAREDDQGNDRLVRRQEPRNDQPQDEQSDARSLEPDAHGAEIDWAKRAAEKRTH